MRRDEGRDEVWGRGRGWELKGRAGWGKGGGGGGGEPAGEEVRSEAGAGTRRGRGDGESARASRVPAAALSAHGSGRRGPRGPPALTWGAPAPNPVPRSGSSFPPCPGDLSAPESRSLRQVPPAASSPRGTPGATPLLASHWLAFTPVICQLAEGSPAMQIRTGPPPRRLAGAAGAEPRGWGSDWSRGPANDADAGRVPGPRARRAACRGSSRGGGGRATLGRSSARSTCGSGGYRPAGGALGPRWGRVPHSLSLGGWGAAAAGRLLGNAAGGGRNHAGGRAGRADAALRAGGGRAGRGLPGPGVGVLRAALHGDRGPASFASRPRLTLGAARASLGVGGPWGPARALAASRLRRARCPWGGPDAGPPRSASRSRGPCRVPVPRPRPRLRRGLFPPARPGAAAQRRRRDFGAPAGGSARPAGPACLGPPCPPRALALTS